MHIGIIGTRGIPNNHGGFEQFAEYLAAGLVENGFEVSVYNSHNHPYQEQSWEGAQIIHCYDPEDKLGTAGQFIYDFNCIMDARKRNFDIILQLGYTSSSVWGRLLPRHKSIVTTNMDGLEWRRSKYSKPVQRFLKYAESLGVKFSDHLISDSLGIQQYLKEQYKKDSTYIPYGAHLFESPDADVLMQYNVVPFAYNMLIARLEPENSIETILDGIAATPGEVPFLVVGKHQTKYGEYLKAKYAGCTKIRFQGGIYNLDHLNNLRHFSAVYFHGHTVGGTNPSLLEAMASNALICAHNNPFNRFILGKDAYYFEAADDVFALLSNAAKQNKQSASNVSFVQNNRNKIADVYAWPIIIQQYIQHFHSINPGYSKKATTRILDGFEMAE